MAMHRASRRGRWARPEQKLRLLTSPTLYAVYWIFTTRRGGGSFFCQPACPLIFQQHLVKKLQIILVNSLRFRKIQRNLTISWDSPQFRQNSAKIAAKNDKFWQKLSKILQNLENSKFAKKLQSKLMRKSENFQDAKVRRCEGSCRSRKMLQN